MELNELETLRKENKILRRELDGLSYGISHDLRDPLRTIIGFSGLLKRSLADKADERSTQMLSDILTNAEQLNVYVEVMLQYSRLSRRELSLIELGDMQRVCRRAADTASGERPNPALDLLISDLPPVMGDSALVEQVFVILLDNAIRFADPDRPLEVEIRGKEVDGNVIFEVSDNGVGFSPERSDDVFSLFQTLEKKEPSNAAQGVGLAMALRIVLRHGGWMKAEGRKGQGATFSFSLPGVEAPTSSLEGDRAETRIELGGGSETPSQVEFEGQVQV